MRVVPLALLVHFEEYEGPVLESNDESVEIDGVNVVPIFQLTSEFKSKNKQCERTQFPFFLAWAITIHKAQGLTLKETVQNIKHGDHAPGMTYVGVSRVKQLQHIMFEEAFDFSRFTPRHSKTAEDRKLDWLHRYGVAPPGEEA